MSQAREWKSEGETEEINGGIKPKQNKICVIPPGKTKQFEEGWRELVATGKTGVGFPMPLEQFNIKFKLNLCNKQCAQSTQEGVLWGKQ